MTENALSILIVYFSVQLQQTEISDRKLFIFQHGMRQAGFQFLSLSQLMETSQVLGLEKVPISE